MGGDRRHALQDHLEVGDGRCLARIQDQDDGLVDDALRGVEQRGRRT